MKKGISLVIVLMFFGTVNAQYKVLLNFDSANGANPLASLILSGDVLYGTASGGGT